MLRTCKNFQSSQQKFYIDPFLFFPVIFPHLRLIDLPISESKSVAIFHHVLKETVNCYHLYSFPHLLEAKWCCRVYSSTCMNLDILLFQSHIGKFLKCITLCSYKSPCWRNEEQVFRTGADLAGAKRSISHHCLLLDTAAPSYNLTPFSNCGSK